MTRSRKRALARSVAIGLVLVACCVAMLNAVLAHQRGELSTGWALAHAFQAAATALAAWFAGHVSRLADWQVAYWRDAYLGADALYRTAAGLLAERRTLAAEVARAVAEDVARAVAEGLTIEERSRLIAEAGRADAEAPSKEDD